MFLILEVVMKTRVLASLFTTASLLYGAYDLSAMNYTLEVGQSVNFDGVRSAPVKLTVDGQTMNTSTSELFSMCKNRTIELEQLSGVFSQISTYYPEPYPVVIGGNNVSFTIFAEGHQVNVSTEAKVPSISIKAPYCYVETMQGLKVDTLDITAHTVNLNPENVTTLNIRASICDFNNTIGRAGKHVYDTVDVTADSVFIKPLTNIIARQLIAQSASGLTYIPKDREGVAQMEEPSCFDLQGEINSENFKAGGYGIFSFYESSTPE